MSVVSEEGVIQPRSLAYGNLNLQSRYHLSPLAGFTNLPFRLICRELGGLGLATTDLVSARGLIEGSPKTLQLIATCEADRPFAVQIFGGDSRVMCDAARLLQDRGVDSIDINMGCPVDRITNGGAGSAMMCRPGDTIDLVRSVVESVQIPVTVKMRLGWDDQQITAPQFAKEFEQAGVAAIAIHGRTRAQGFSGTVSREGIRKVVEAVDRIPVIGNGDIRTVEDAQLMFRDTGCAAISIGRGALANPWIFRQLVEYETTGTYGPAGSFEDRLTLMIRQFQYLIDLVGESRGITAFRKMAHWYLKSMFVGPALRHQFQVAQTKLEIDSALQAIRQAGPVRGPRTGELPGMHIPVPSGPVERW